MRLEFSRSFLTTMSLTPGEVDYDTVDDINPA